VIAGISSQKSHPEKGWLFCIYGHFTGIHAHRLFASNGNEMKGGQMPSYRFWCIAFLSLASLLPAQTNTPSRYQLFGGYSFLSNSINGVSGSHQPLNGAEIAFAIPPWHDLRFKLNGFFYHGTNEGATEHPYFIMAGGQYGRNFGRESAFVEALGGEGNINANWGPNQTIGDTASFSAIFGGGLDTPVSRRFELRVQGDFQYAYFKIAASRSPGTGVPTYMPGLPNYFGRVSSGLVWRF
jgi:hypothetical protein